jgi:hypothetical protein
MMEEKSKKQLSLRTRTTVSLFIYYILLIFGSGAFAYRTLVSGYHEFITTSGTVSNNNRLILCVLMAFVGAAIYNSRKLYKACINDEYSFSNGAPQRLIGTIFFFVLRPLTAAVLSAVTFMIWQVSIISSVHGFSGFSLSHFYLAGILGFSVGFLAGKVLSKVEELARSQLQGILP